MSSNRSSTQNEPVRFSGALLFKLNLTDPYLYISTFVAYLVSSILLTRNASTFTFILLFSSIFWLIDTQIESYRSFKLVRKYTSKLSKNKQSLRHFLGTHLGHNFSLDYQVDTFRWLNKLIASFWPHVSHIVHYELNEFIRKSKKLTKPGASKTMRLIYAIGRQIDANIMAIEHCQLGARAPYVKFIRVLVDYEEINSGNSLLGPRRRKRAISPAISSNKLLVYDVDIAYEGNMNISFIYRYLCCCNSRLGLRDVFIHMRSRLAIGPIHDNVPKLEKFDFSLLELPEFGYKGIAIVELARLKIARRSINRMIKEHLLFPKSISIDIDKLLADGNGDVELKQQTQLSPRNARLQSNTNGEKQQPELPFCTRMLAKFLVCSCLCTNCCLKYCCCQCNVDERAATTATSKTDSV